MPNLEIFIKVTCALLIIIGFAQLFGRLIKLIGQPAVVGEMISGVILGPTVAGYFFPEAMSEVFPKDIMPVLFVLSNLGLSIYMFLVGAEVDVKLFNKRTIGDATVLSAAAIIVPFVLGALIAYGFSDQQKPEPYNQQSIAVNQHSKLSLEHQPYHRISLRKDQ